MKQVLQALGVVAFVLLWPHLLEMIYFAINVMLATGRKCGIEGCTFPTGPSWEIARWAPRVLVPIWWLRRLRNERAFANSSPP
ncbi:MAG TPA: hypothetical protein VE967_10195 [Gemmatimonadaceae bacterium]|nr:hypothetical protein [Gemmatimonadaceae bacterium]